MGMGILMAPEYVGASPRARAAALVAHGCGTWRRAIGRHGRMLCWDCHDTRTRDTAVPASITDVHGPGGMEYAQWDRCRGGMGRDDAALLRAVDQHQQRELKRSTHCSTEGLSSSFARSARTWRREGRRGRDGRARRFCFFFKNNFEKREREGSWVLLCNECGRLHCPGAALRKSLGLAHSLPCGSCQAPSILVVSFHREAARSPQEDGDVGDPPVPSAETNGSNCRKAVRAELSSLLLLESQRTH